MRAQIVHRVRAVAFIAVACIDAPHENLPIASYVGEGFAEQQLDLRLAHGTAFNGEKVIFFVHETLVRDALEFLFEDGIEPDARAATVALAKRVRDIHFHISPTALVLTLFGIATVGIHLFIATIIWTLLTVYMDSSFFAVCTYSAVGFFVWFALTWASQ
ncbi:hypothetical protein [Coriobacterium glomerans]|uniref:hypothetical protein n=1 Tax=Coriobacterium glomerans TaxID=33871 RepID=UPI00059F6471